MQLKEMDYDDWKSYHLCIYIPLFIYGSFNSVINSWNSRDTVTNEVGRLLLSSGMFLHVVSQKLIYRLEVFTAFLIRASVLEIEVVNTSDPFVNFYETTRCIIPKTVIFVLAALRN
jgi:hypothetical protein